MSQTALLNQFIDYLKLKKTETNSYDPDRVDNLIRDFKEGHCFGLAFCCAVMASERMLNPWLAKLVKAYYWNGTSEALKKPVQVSASLDKKPVTLDNIFEELIHYVAFHQAGESTLYFLNHGGGQGHYKWARSVPPIDFSSLSQLNIIREGVKCFEFVNKEGKIKHIEADAFIKDEFIAEGLIYVFDEEIIKSCACLIHSDQHAIAVIYDKGLWGVYDPNYPHDSILNLIRYFDNKQALAEEIIHILGNDLTINLATLEKENGVKLLVWKQNYIEISFLLKIFCEKEIALFAKSLFTKNEQRKTAIEYWQKESKQLTEILKMVKQSYSASKAFFSEILLQNMEHIEFFQQNEFFNKLNFSLILDIIKNAPGGVVWLAEQLCRAEESTDEIGIQILWKSASLQYLVFLLTAIDKTKDDEEANEVSSSIFSMLKCSIKEPEQTVLTYLIGDDKFSENLFYSILGIIAKSNSQLELFYKWLTISDEEGWTALQKILFLRPSFLIPLLTIGKNIPHLVYSIIYILEKENPNGFTGREFLESGLAVSDVQLSEIALLIKEIVTIQQQKIAETEETEKEKISVKPTPLPRSIFWKNSPQSDTSVEHKCETINNPRLT